MQVAKSRQAASRPRHPGLANWQREAHLRRRESAVRQDGSCCPLTRDLVAHVARRDLYLASDGHLYVGSAFASFVLAERSVGRSLPLSPLTRQPLALDTARLFAAPTPLPDLPRARWTPKKTFALKVACRTVEELGLTATLLVMKMHHAQLDDPPYAASAGLLLACTGIAAALLLCAPGPRREQGARQAQPFTLASDAGALGFKMSGFLWLTCAQKFTANLERAEAPVFFLALLGTCAVPLATCYRRSLDTPLARTQPDPFAASLRYFSLWEGDVLDEPDLAADLARLFAAP